MIYSYNYTDEELKYYDKLNRCTIREDYCMFMIEDGIYKIGFHEVVRYIQDFYEDCYIGDEDGICDYISALADSYDLSSIVRLVDGLDTDNEYYIIDYYDNIVPFNNMDNVAEIYDVADIISDMVSKCEVDDYCEQLEEF